MYKGKVYEFEKSLLPPTTITVFTSQIDRWVDEVAQKITERSSGGRLGLEEGIVDRMVKEEVDRIGQKIKAGKYKYFAIVFGNFGTGGKTCVITRAGSFLYELQDNLTFYISHREEILSKRNRRNEMRHDWEEEDETYEDMYEWDERDETDEDVYEWDEGGRSQGPSLEEALANPIPTLSYKDINDWTLKIARNIFRKIGKPTKMEKVDNEAVMREAEEAVSKIDSMLKDLGSRYVNIVYNYIDYNSLDEQDCEILSAERFIDFLVDMIHEGISYIIQTIRYNRYFAKGYYED